MSYQAGIAPYLRRREQRGLFSWNVCFALASLFALSCFYYGWRSLWVALSGVGAAVGAELICLLLWRKKASALLDGTAVVTGGIVAAAMSPLTPLWMPVVGATFAIVAVKIPFGGSGRSVFNPAAGGIAFVTVCFPDEMFRYPLYAVKQTLETMSIGRSPAALLADGIPPSRQWGDIWLGSFPGAIGGVAILLLLVCMAFLLLRRATLPLVLTGYFAACTAMALCFPRVDVGGNLLRSALSELSAGYLLFGGIFMVCEPVTAPKHPLARVVYGVLTGVLVMSLRYFGRFEDGVCFAVLFANLFASAIDRWCWSLARWVCD